MGGIKSGLDERCAQGDAVREIHAQHHDGCSADGRAANQERALAAKVVTPFVTVWVNKPGNLAGYGIDAGHVRAFAQIILMAGISKIIQEIAATMLPGNDVLNVEGEERIVVLMEPAIFAAPPSAAANQRAGGCFDHEAGVSRARALA